MLFQARNTQVRALKLLLASLVLFAPQIIFAATLSLSPAAVSVSAGDTFTLHVMVSSSDQPMNAISGALSFPYGLLQVDSISTVNSVLTLWVQQPAYSNQNGTITFSGVVPNPGYQGDAVQVVSIRMTALATGTGTVSFTSSSVLANDGNGTDILTNAASAQIAVTQAPVIPPSPPTKPVSVPASRVTPTTTLAAVTQMTTTTVTRAIEPRIFGTPLSLIGWYLALFEFLILLILLIVFLVLLYLLYRSHVSRPTAYERLSHAYMLIHERFNKLRSAIMAQVAALEYAQKSRTLTHEEQSFVADSKKLLDESKHVLDQEVDHVLHP